MMDEDVALAKGGLESPVLSFVYSRGFSLA